MKKSRAHKLALLPVETRETVDIHTGEVSQMAVEVSERIPLFSYVFATRQLSLLKDARMTGEAWRVLGMMQVYVSFETNEVTKPIGTIAKELGLQRQTVGRAIRLLRQIGVVLPSQQWGKYHLCAELVYRGNLHLRQHLLRRQEVRKR